MKVYSQLEVASLENLASDPANLPLGRFYFRTDVDKVAYKDAAGVKFLASELYVDAAGGVDFVTAVGGNTLTRVKGDDQQTVFFGTNTGTQTIVLPDVTAGDMVVGDPWPVINRSNCTVVVQDHTLATIATLAKNQWFDGRVRNTGGTPYWGTKVIPMFDSTNTYLDAASKPIQNVTDPTNAQDAATKNYIDTFSVFTAIAKGFAPASGGGTTNFLRADGSWAAPASGGSGKLGYAIFTGSTSWAVPAGVTSMRMLVVGGGGGSGGTWYSFSSEAGAQGGSGGGGGVAWGTFTVTAGQVLTIGVGGGGGGGLGNTSYGTSGGGGGQSYVSGFISANGGGGGVGGNLGINSGGGGGGTSGGIGINGQSGSAGIAYGSQASYFAQGGDSYGHGGRVSGGQSWGGGAGAPVDIQNGFAGHQGIVILEWVGP